MAKSGYTVILVPEDRARFRKFRIRPDALWTVFGILVSLISIASYFLSTLARPPAPVASLQQAAQVETDLKKAAQSFRDRMASSEAIAHQANQELLKALDNSSLALSSLVEATKGQQAELVDLRSRYDALAPLVAGQERLAEAYRTILTRRTLADRVADIGVSFALGVFSSLIAAYLWALKRGRVMPARHSSGTGTHTE